MTDETAATPETSEETAAAAAAPDNGEAEERARLEAENSEMKDRVLRTLAEMENLRKRTEREVADARAYAVTSFARDLLSVADNLDRALAAVPAEEAGEGALKSLMEGVQMTGREFASTLAKHGVARIEPKPGDRFDPNLHQAMFEVPDPTQPAGNVVQVVQQGYTVSGRLLRPALVGVSAGGPKATAPEGASIDRKA